MHVLQIAEVDWVHCEQCFLFVYSDILQSSPVCGAQCVREGGVDIGDRGHWWNLAMAVSGMLG